MSAYDVIVYDDCSSAFAPPIAERKGLGGVEWTLMLLAEALADEGLRVLVLNKLDGAWRRSDVLHHGVLEYGHVSRAHAEKISCEALVVSRWSAVPPIAARRVAFSMHDIPVTWMYDHQRRWLDAGAPTVCVSTWLSDRLGEIGDVGGRYASRGWRRPVIAPMLLDECYERTVERDPSVFVYASAAVKGLPQTIDAWALLREHYPEVHLTRLQVATNGYDAPSAADAARMAELGIESLGQLPCRGIIAALRNAAGMFTVNTYPETHGIVASTALALGCRCHVLTLRDPAALPETLAGAPYLTSDRHAFVERFVRAYLDDEHGPPADQAPDRRARALLPAWRKVLFDGQ